MALEFGLFRGKVVYNKDPLKMGRVKVLISDIHSDMDKDLKTEELPWAHPCLPAYGGWEHGRFTPPIPGDTVWVFPEARPTGQKQYVYLGWCPSISEDKGKRYEFEDYEYKGDPSKPDVPQDPWWKKEQDEKPEPTKTVWAKTLKGHTITAEDSKEKENFTFVDRLGQMLKFICPVKTDVNESSKGVRRRRSVLGQESYDYEEDTPDSKAVLFIKAICGHLLRFVSEKEKDKVELIAVDKEERESSGEESGGEGGDEDKHKKRAMVGLYTGTSDETRGPRSVILAEDKENKVKAVLELDGKKKEIHLSLIVEDECVNGIHLNDKMGRWHCVGQIVINKAINEPDDVCSYNYEFEDTKDEEYQNEDDSSESGGGEG